MAATIEVAGIPVVWHHLVEGDPPEGFGLFVPQNPDAILEDLDEEEFAANDEKMPYFATLWPAAEKLAKIILEGTDWRDLRVLDLGCGVGAVGLAAASRGARVTYLDWEPRALAIVERSAQSLQLPAEALVAADWRSPPELQSFDRVLAADVLYEERNVVPLARFFRKHLSPGGEAWIADPGRPYARDLPAALQEEDLWLAEDRLVTDRELCPPISLIRICLDRPPASDQPRVDPGPA
jgi:predicted nicotinamide N-methyase